MAVVKAFGSEGYESRRVREGSERRLASGVAGRAAAGALRRARRLGEGDQHRGRARGRRDPRLPRRDQPGELLVFASYTRKAQSPMRSFARELTKVAAAMAKAERIAELLAADDVLPEPPGRLPRRRAPPATSRSRTSRSATAPSGRCCSGVSLRVGPGERLALMGPSGVGKSTLGALVARFFDPTEGRVLIDGRDARECSLDVAARAGRGAAPGHRAVQRHGAREHRLRDRRVARAGRGRGARGGGGRVHPRAAAGLRHRARPAGRRPLGRPAPADRHRAHAAARPAGARARRADHRARRRQRDGRARRPAGADGAGARRS